ncbi:MAG TPA: DUF882 domain-containing protein [Stellaceae bacterium]|nr:DUF882 domain-containing protein [Stellaceae bacterium]
MHAGPPGSRRRILAFAAGALVTAAAAPASAALRFTDRRTLSFHHLHTGESLEATYWIDGRYQPRELERINRLLRDFRTGEVYPIDLELLDLLLALRRRLASRAPFQVISGYRSPATNAMLASLTEGVSSNSLHLSGQAIDIRLPDRSLGMMNRAALSLQGGGVGYYPRSDFIHLDVGRVRRW